MNQNVAHTVYKDLMQYFKSENIAIFGDNNEPLVITPAHLFTKENRRLNRLLGIHSINKQWKHNLNKKR